VHETGGLPESAEPRLVIDFTAGTQAWRRYRGGGGGQAVARAVGVSGGLGSGKRGTKPTVIDCTAGLGRDAFQLAALGCRVTMIERNPEVAAALRRALEAAAAHEGTKDVVPALLSLIEGDAREVLARLSSDERPDVVYLDPMFPERTKSALVKQEMRVLRTLCGDDPDAEALFAAAIKAARRRTVVKRPSHARPLGAAIGVVPAGAVEAAGTRFDIYAPLV
jgi:16S rRNA (guanine1516-N2)-methyltransferase